MSLEKALTEMGGEPLAQVQMLAGECQGKALF